MMANPAESKHFLYYWYRDCDMAEADGVTVFVGSPSDLDVHMRKMWNDLRAEGSARVVEITKEDFLEFEPTFRDRAAEAWENGNGTSVYV